MYFVVILMLVVVLSALQPVESWQLCLVPKWVSPKVEDLGQLGYGK